MDENTSLINIGELSKPATVLVERISEAVGGIFRPYQVVRVAKAEAQAERVRAENEIQISDLHRRAFSRFLNEVVENPATYYGRKAELKWDYGDRCVLGTGRVQLTNVGLELAPICSAKSVEGFFESMLDYWWFRYFIKGSEVNAKGA